MTEKTSRMNQDRFMRICDLKAISYTQLKCVTEQKVRDIRAGKSRLSIEEWEAFKQEIALLRDNLSMYLTADKPQVSLSTNVIAEKKIKHHALVPGRRTLFDMIRQGITLKESDMATIYAATEELYHQLKI